MAEPSKNADAQKDAVSGSPAAAQVPAGAAGPGDERPIIIRTINLKKHYQMKMVIIQKSE